jgi:hypothetical protein
MLDPFLRMNWLFFVHSGAMHLADGGDFDPCMHAHTINHTHRCFHFFPKVGLKFEADHWQVDTSGSHYFIHFASGCSKAGPTAPDTFAAHSALRATGGRFLWWCSLSVCVYHQRFRSRFPRRTCVGRCTSLVFTSRFRCSESMFMQQYSRFLANSPVITLIIDHRPTFSSTSRRGSTQLVKARSNILKIKLVSNITIFFLNSCSRPTSCCTERWWVLLNYCVVMCPKTCTHLSHIQAYYSCAQRHSRWFWISCNYQCLLFRF